MSFTKKYKNIHKEQNWCLLDFRIEQQSFVDQIRICGAMLLFSQTAKGFICHACALFVGAVLRKTVKHLKLLNLIQN